MNLTFSFSVTTLLAIVISTATAQEQVYNQIQASPGTTSGTSGAAGGSGGSPFQHQHNDHERQQQLEKRTQQLRGGRGRHPSTSLLEAVKVDAGSCSNLCNTFINDCCPGYTCNSVGSIYYPAYACQNSALLSEAVKVDAGSCSNECSTWSDDCCPGYTCQSVGSLFPHLACVPS